MFSTLRNNIILRIGMAVTAALLLFLLWTVFATAGDWQDEYSFAALMWAVGLVLIACTGMWIPGRGRWFALGLFAVAFGLKLAMALWAEAEPFSDFLTMYNAAADLSRGGFDETQAYWPYLLRWAYQTFFVAYEAVILWAFPSSFGLTPLLMTNTLWMAGANVLVYALARQCMSERGARLAALLYLLFPAPYLLAPVLTNQHVSLFFALLGLWLLMRGKRVVWFVPAGVCLAVGNALRPDVLLLAAALGGVLLLRLLGRLTRWKTEWQWKAVWADTMPVAVSVGVCWLTGVALSAVFVVSGLNPNGLKNMNPEWKFVIGLNMATGGGFSQPLYDRVFPTAEGEKDVFLFDLETSREVSRIVVREHMRMPKRAMADFLFEKTVRAWGFTESTSWAFRGQDERMTPFGVTVEEAAGVWRYAERIYFAVVCALAAFGAAMQWRRKDVSVVLVACGLMLALFIGVHVLIEVQTRYRHFVMPFVFMLTAGVPLGFVRAKKGNLLE